MKDIVDFEEISKMNEEVSKMVEEIYEMGHDKLEDEPDEIEDLKLDDGKKKLHSIKVAH